MVSVDEKISILTREAYQRYHMSQRIKECYHRNEYGAMVVEKRCIQMVMHEFWSSPEGNRLAEEMSKLRLEERGRMTQ